jgi:magnesium chelatase subunit D
MKRTSSPAEPWQAALRVLAASSLHPGLRRLLIFDASADDLEIMAETTKAMLEAATGSAVSRVTLAPFHDEDDLWGLGEGLPAGWHRPGLLVPSDALKGWRLVVIPDLTVLSLPAARAALQLLETDLGRLERHGQSRSWRSRLSWLAACSSSAIGQVSPHLLDRFPVRLQMGVWRVESHVAHLRRWLSDPALSQTPQDETIQELVEALRKSISKDLPPLTAEAIEETIDLLLPWEASGVRRHLGLARLAQALSCLDGETETSPDQVWEAASLMTFFGSEGVRKSSAPPPDTSNLAAVDDPVSAGTEHSTPSTGSIQPGEQQASPSVHQPELLIDASSDLDVEPAEEVALNLSPFPEDQAPVERFAAPLQLAREDSPQRVRRGGAVSGVRSTADPAEVAPVPTLFAAAPFQLLRRRSRGAKVAPFIITAADWRARRRAPCPEDLFVLVLDFTAYGESDWHAALVPYVREAYVRRSAVCLISVGAAGAPCELRAEKVLARNILAPEILAALNRERGRATPLASGLELARETIRDAQYRGRGAILRSQLVVLSDGRGNIPLEASRTGLLSGPVGSQGIFDALQAAARLAALCQVESVVLDPQPRYAAHLVKELAETLEARIATIPRRESILEASA